MQPPALPGVPGENNSFEPPAEPGANKRILLVDTVGELGAWWGAAHVAFVGGSFGSRGGQNMIEPAAYGAAVSFGSNTRNFRDIVAALLAADAAKVVRDAGEFEAFVAKCLDEPAFAAELGRRAQALVNSQLGATKSTVRLLDTMFSASTEQLSMKRSAA
jgi:3-deoxy-D-manno-octulosonic-acid transferase